jgi:hypothetical protein
MSTRNPTVTGFSGFWDLTGDLNPYKPFNNLAPTTGFLGWRSKLEWQIAKLLNKQQMREIKALMFGLTGAVSGANVTKTYARVQAPSGPSAATPEVTGVADLGGLVPIETITVINRNTDANDVTYLKSMMNNDMLMRGMSLQVDISGNGANSRASQLGF